MPIADLLGGRGTVPTVRAFFRMLVMCGPEVHIARQLVAAVPDGLDMSLAIAPFLATPGDRRIAYVLEGCTLPEPVAVAALLESLTRYDVLIGKPSQDEARDDVDPQSALVIDVADGSHCSPLEVMEWPMGTLVDVLARRMARNAPETNPDTQPEISGFMVTERSGPVIGGAQ